MSTKIRPIACAADTAERLARLDNYCAAVRRGEDIAYIRGRLVYGQQVQRQEVEDSDD